MTSREPFLQECGHLDIRDMGLRPWGEAHRLPGCATLRRAPGGPQRSTAVTRTRSRSTSSGSTLRQKRSEQGRRQRHQGLERSHGLSTMMLDLCHPPPPPPRDPTARATTMSDVNSAAVASMPMRIFSREVNGIVSVGLNALELVNET